MSIGFRSRRLSSETESFSLCRPFHREPLHYIIKLQSRWLAVGFQQLFIVQKKKIEKRRNQRSFRYDSKSTILKVCFMRTRKHASSTTAPSWCRLSNGRRAATRV